MANKTAILKKIQRDLEQLGLTVTVGATTITCGRCIISYVDATIQAPMGGVDGTASPFLGIGVAAPGKLHIRGTGTLDTLPTIFVDINDFRVLRTVCGHANNVTIGTGTADASLGELPGSCDVLGLGM